jgi:ubiquinone biosynthesis protein UbiJ
MRIPDRLLQSFETALNRYLMLDPETMQGMAQLSGRCIGIELAGTGIRIYIHPDHDGVHLTEHAEQVDTMLHGTPLSLLQLGLGSDASKTLFSGEVTITGNVETGQAFKSILDAMDIDWEEQLARLTGDVFAHQAGNAVHRIRNTLRQGGNTLQQDLGEYLQEELRLVPGRIEIRNLADDINRLRAAADRLEARIRRLQGAGR